MSRLCLLDLTAAFDNVDHDLLMSQTGRQFGLWGVVLQWFTVHICQTDLFKSCSKAVRRVWLSSFVVPQGSVLGPDCLFFIQRTCQMWLRHTILTYTRMLTTLSCICGVAGNTGSWLLNDFNYALQM